jgi:hypothetical protein
MRHTFSQLVEIVVDSLGAEGLPVPPIQERGQMAALLQPRQLHGDWECVLAGLLEMIARPNKEILETVSRMGERKWAYDPPFTLPPEVLKPGSKHLLLLAVEQLHAEYEENGDDVESLTKLKEGLEDWLTELEWTPSKGQGRPATGDDDVYLMEAIIGDGPYQSRMLRAAARMLLAVKRTSWTAIREPSEDEILEECQRIRSSCARRGLFLNESQG